MAGKHGTIKTCQRRGGKRRGDITRALRIRLKALFLDLDSWDAERGALTENDTSSSGAFGKWLDAKFPGTAFSCRYLKAETPRQEDMLSKVSLAGL